jgi:hypothetical protein
MPALRSILATLISIAVVLSPIATSTALSAMPAAIMGDTGAGTSSSMDKACPCCDEHGKCVMATCGMNCQQLGPAPGPAFYLADVGRNILSANVAQKYRGLALRPPTPPPRA